MPETSAPLGERRTEDTGERPTMSKITRCRECGGNIVEPAYPGDGAYTVAPMCLCNTETARAYRIEGASTIALRGRTSASVGHAEGTANAE